MATGTVISTPSGNIIDSANIGLYPASTLDTAKANTYHTKRIKPAKSKK